MASSRAVSGRRRRWATSTSLGSLCRALISSKEQQQQQLWVSELLENFEMRSTWLALLGTAARTQ